MKKLFICPDGCAIAVDHIVHIGIVRPIHHNSEYKSGFDITLTATGEYDYVVYCTNEEEANNYRSNLLSLFE